MRSFEELEPFRDRGARVTGLYGDQITGKHHGVFRVPSESSPGDVLLILASRADGWDHVSVSLVSRCPTWAEMSQVARLFFKPGETAMQLHVPARDHVNAAETCLHLWRPLRGRPIPRPPKELVGGGPLLEGR